MSAEIVDKDAPIFKKTRPVMTVLWLVMVAAAVYGAIVYGHVGAWILGAVGMTLIGGFFYLVWEISYQDRNGYYYLSIGD